MPWRRRSQRGDSRSVRPPSVTSKVIPVAIRAIVRQPGAKKFATKRLSEPKLPTKVMDMNTDPRMRDGAISATSIGSATPGPPMPMPASTRPAISIQTVGGWSSVVGGGTGASAISAMPHSTSEEPHTKPKRRPYLTQARWGPRRRHLIHCSGVLATTSQRACSLSRTRRTAERRKGQP